MKILCIDGGGIRGIFAVAILKALEEDLKNSIGNYFDLVAGTSTGAIIASSIVLKKEMKDVFNLYKEDGKKIFVKNAKIGIFKHIYSDRFLRRYLQRAFGNIQLSQIQTPLLIPVVDITNGKPYVHRSNFAGIAAHPDRVMLWDAVLSSCSAPVYFPPNNLNNHSLSVDGGLWANNPSMVCLTEALDHFHEHLGNIKILSIGTGLQKIDFNLAGSRNWGTQAWLPFDIPTMKLTPKLLDLSLHISSEATTYHCSHLLKDNYLRINCDLKKEIAFDDTSYIDELIAFGQQSYEMHKAEIISFLHK